MAMVSVEEIGLYRRGPDNDIDLQAVFGGRISGKKEKDLKVNPLYNDRNSVSQYSDINGNMSPVHVVTYESFPQTRTKNLPSENGNIKNGDVQQLTGENWSVNSNSGFHRNSAKTDSNHNIEGEANNRTVSSDSSNAPKLVHLQYQDLESGEEYSKLKSCEIDNSRKNTTDEKHVYNFSRQSENSIVQNSKGFRKDYSLLSYKNESFVLDEKDIVNIPKETEEIDVNTSKCHELQNSSGHEINSEPENKADLVSEVDENLVNPNSVQVNQSSVSNLTENTSLEKPNNNDLPESTYHELNNVCDMQNLEHNDLTNTNDSSGNIQEELSDFGDSPQTCHKEILTEVLVHNAELHESPRMLFHAGYSEGNSVCYSLDTEKNQIEIPLQADTSDWPDIDDLVRPVQGETLDRSETEIAQKTECRAMIKGHVRSVSDVIIQESEAEEDAEDKGDKCDVSDLDGSSLYKKKQTKKKSNSKAGVVSEANSSTRTLKSILSSTSSYHSCSIENDHKRQNSDSEIQELKTVKFSEDTVFNENKSNRYKKEKFGQINLRELYRGKIMSDEAVAKMNPLYQPEETVLDKVGAEEEQNSPTDNDKLTYELTLKNAMRLSKGKPGSLNGPSYLEQYLIMKAHGIKAVFGGRISGKKEKDLKVNPLYNDRNSVSQYSDINGNMNPVHVVTYESFPQTRTKNLPSENGNIKNGDVQQHTGENWSVNSNSGFHRNSAKTDSNHNIEGEANNRTVSSDSSNAPKLVHLQYQDLESGEEYSKLKSCEIDNSRKNTTDEKHVYNFSPQSENSIEQNSKGFRKDYSLLSYKIESFVLDEKDIVNIPKETEDIDVNTSKCHEIQNSSGHEINSEPENKADLVSEVDENLVNPNSVQVNQSSVSNLTENTSLEKPNNNDLPESTYHELINVCDMQNLEHIDLTNTNDSSGNIQEELSDFGDSPQTCHKEILTEVLVHNAEPHESPRMLFHAGYSEGNSVCYSLDTEKNQIEIPLQADTSDWPDIDDLVRPVQGETLDRSETEIAQKTECRAMIKGHVRSVSDVIIQESEAEEDAEDKGDKCDVSDLDGSSLYKKKQTKKKSSSKAGVVSEANSSTRTLKSILSSTSSYHSCSIENDHKRQNSDSEIQELKTVKFSEDTVFNENKSNRYKKEKFGQINLRELYRGKIMSDEAVAKMNPLYQPEETVLDKVGGEEEQNSPTDNDKLTYELTLKNAMRLSKGKPGSLNGPSYLEQYLIMKAHGIKKDNVDIERLPETMEIPVYDRLIQRTLAKERRKICVKWSMVILTVAIITAVAATLRVYFKEGF